MRFVQILLQKLFDLPMSVEFCGCSPGVSVAVLVLWVVLLVYCRCTLPPLGKGCVMVLYVVCGMQCFCIVLFLGILSDMFMASGFLFCALVLCKKASWVVHLGIFIQGFQIPTAPSALPVSSATSFLIVFFICYFTSLPPCPVALSLCPLSACADTFRWVLIPKKACKCW